MNDEKDEVLVSQVATEDARQELERLLSDCSFHITDRNRAFLRYIAEETFAGRSKGVKAYSVAIDVFGRPSNFDPNIDPIVRIEAARLRASLDQYYDAHGMAEQVRIRLPRGAYIADFSRIIADGTAPSVKPGDHQVDGSANDAGASPVTPGTLQSVRWPLLAGLGGALLAVAASIVFMVGQFLGLQASGSTALTEKPMVVMTLTVRDPRDRMRGEGLEDGLMIALSRFGTLRLASNAPRDPVRAKATVGISDKKLIKRRMYQISMKYNTLEGVPSVLWKIVDAGSGETVDSGEDRPKDTARTLEESDAMLISALASRFGASSGALNSLELQNDYPAEALGNICVLRAERAIGLLNSMGLVLGRSCLEATIASDTRNADAQAVLSRILVLQDEADGTNANLSRAVDLSNQAISAAPGSDRSLMARMVVQYANGQREAAFETGRAAMNLNPLNSDLAGALAFRLYISGFGPEALGIIGKISVDPDMRSRDADIVMALDAFNRGDQQEALKCLGSVIYDDSLSYAIRIAALIRSGNHADAITTYRSTRKIYPDFPVLVKGAMKMKRFTPALQTAIERDLVLAAR